MNSRMRRLRFLVWVLPRLITRTFALVSSHATRVVVRVGSTRKTHTQFATVEIGARGLIRVMGHEVNNSLAPIKSLAETLQELLAVALPAGAGRAETLDGLRVIAERTPSPARFLSQ